MWGLRPHAPAGSAADPPRPSRAACSAVGSAPGPPRRTHAVRTDAHAHASVGGVSRMPEQRASTRMRNTSTSRQACLDVGRARVARGSPPIRPDLFLCVGAAPPCPRRIGVGPACAPDDRHEGRDELSDSRAWSPTPSHTPSEARLSVGWSARCARLADPPARTFSWCGGCAPTPPPDRNRSRPFAGLRTASEVQCAERPPRRGAAPRPLHASPSAAHASAGRARATMAQAAERLPRPSTLRSQSRVTARHQAHGDLAGALGAPDRGGPRRTSQARCREASAAQVTTDQRGGVGGAAHHRERHPGAGGWGAARSARSSDIRAGTQASRAGERQRPRAPEPRSGHAPDERASTAVRSRVAARGRGGRSPPQRKTSGGGRVGSDAQRTLVRHPRRHASLEGRRASAPSRSRAAVRPCAG